MTVEFQKINSYESRMYVDGQLARSSIAFNEKMMLDQRPMAFLSLMLTPEEIDNAEIVATNMESFNHNLNYISIIYGYDRTPLKEKFPFTNELVKGLFS
jgi:hypothetical protein